MAPFCFAEQAREFRPASERLERGFPIEVRETRKNPNRPRARGT